MFSWLQHDDDVDSKYIFSPPCQILIRNRATDLDSRMYDGSTALILVARLPVEGMVEELITCHADVNAVDELGESARENFSALFPLTGRF